MKSARAEKFRKSGFLILLLIFFLVGDRIAGTIGLRGILRSGLVDANDFQLTLRDHPEREYDKVFFGGSLVYAGYREDYSTSGYVNFGIDDGSVQDIDQMLRRGMIKVDSDLVVGVNLLSFLDSFQTDPTYAWHRSRLEPFAYFYRDQWKQYLEAEAKNVVRRVSGRRVPNPPYQNQTKTYYHGVIDSAGMEEKLTRFRTQYWNQPIEGYRKNLSALSDLIHYCSSHGIRLRIVWMPRNPDVEKPEILQTLMDEVSRICEEGNVEIYDMTDTLDADCFYDFGHLNYEYGAYLFTEEIDPWLNSETVSTDS